MFDLICLQLWKNRTLILQTTQKISEKTFCVQINASSFSCFGCCGTCKNSKCFQHIPYANTNRTKNHVCIFTAHISDCHQHFTKKLQSKSSRNCFWQALVAQAINHNPTVYSTNGYPKHLENLNYNNASRKMSKKFKLLYISQNSRPT